MLAASDSSSPRSWTRCELPVWVLHEGDKLEEFVNKHLIPDKDKIKIRGLIETVYELFTVYEDKSYPPAIVVA